MRLSGRTVVVAWLLWTALLGALAVSLGKANVGIALPISSASARALSERWWFVIPALLYSPPLVATVIWWLYRRDTSAAR